MNRQTSPQAKPLAHPQASDAGQRAPALAQVLASAAACVQAVRGGRSGTAALDAVPAPLRPAVQAVFFDVLRHWGWAQAVRQQLAPRVPVAATDALLCTALALLAPGASASYEPHTLVNQAVQAAKSQKATLAQAGFINACLRRFLRERESLAAAALQDEQARWNHPSWWVQRVRQDHPAQWQDILRANRLQAPMVLRVNQQKCTVAQYQSALHAINVVANKVGECGLVLQRALPVQALPGFGQGWVSVQDAGAQLAAPLLLQGWDLQQPLRILDTCAAPGGKTAHLLERAGAGSQLQVTALEVDAQRCQRIHGTLERLGLSAQVLVADAGKPEDWWAQHCGGVLFDGILLDAPCTASGIVRRHPDVPWLRRASDVEQLARTQAQLLRALWPLVRPGGRLLYCTCSVFKAEGSDQIKAFLAHNTDARWMPSPGHLLPGSAPKGNGVLDNGPGEHDGFFYALLEKHAA